MLNKKHKEEIENLEKCQQEDSWRIEELEQQLTEWGKSVVRITVHTVSCPLWLKLIACDIFW